MLPGNIPGVTARSCDRVSTMRTLYSNSCFHALLAHLVQTGMITTSITSPYFCTGLAQMLQKLCLTLGRLQRIA